MARIGRVPVVPDEAPPYLYIVDTIPESLAHTDTPPTARHGRTLRELAENILCANASSECAARIVNTLGLPRVTPELVDLEHGGSFGTLVDLARGIDAAIDDWDLSALTPPSAPPTVPPSPAARAWGRSWAPPAPGIFYGGGVLRCADAH